MSKDDIILNLKRGLDVEYKALDGYREFLALIGDKADRDRLEMVIADEMNHIKMVEHLIDVVNQYVR